MQIKSKIKHQIANFYSSFIKEKRSRIIYYHDIHQDNKKKYYEYSTPISLFLEHIKLIRHLEYEIVDEITKPLKQVQITFDDGYRGIVSFKNLIKELDIYIKIFIITSSINKPNYLSKKEISSLNVDKNFSFGAHTHNHIPLITCGKAKLNDELRVSKEIMSDLLSTNIKELAFPIGKFNELVINESKNVGYEKLYSAIPGKYFNKYQYLYRNLVQNLTPENFITSLMGGCDIFQFHYERLARQ
ncbi:polysaccharide deacetylase family protein [Candidatus Marinimicrobia bacterium]|nr:polysaccharide deacetylase family protein [Candidatus Neomarinimicrobiota bacterium]